MIIAIVCIWMCVKRKSQGVRNLQMPMNCSMNCYKPQRKERPMEPSGEFPNQATKMLSQEDELQDMKLRLFLLQPKSGEETMALSAATKPIHGHLFLSLLLARMCLMLAEDFQNQTVVGW
ncbi:uncharacterized protein LOC143268908 [Peromyscus maniculatus bairdii]|uniref:uncharacterized protein LOC143268908 n=1 Tax=Peromyscus maniculatus bairdii TaxID=230844 RepID=UPI003FD0820F